MHAVRACQMVVHMCGSVCNTYSSLLHGDPRHPVISMPCVKACTTYPAAKNISLIFLNFAAGDKAPNSPKAAHEPLPRAALLNGKTSRPRQANGDPLHTTSSAAAAGRHSDTQDSVQIHAADGTHKAHHGSDRRQKSNKGTCGIVPPGGNAGVQGPEAVRLNFENSDVGFGNDLWRKCCLIYFQKQIRGPAPPFKF